MARKTKAADRPIDKANSAETRGAAGELHQTASADVETLTTSQGAPVADDQNTLRHGARGPALMEDFHFREKVGQKLTTDQTVSDWVGKSVGYFLVAKCIRALRLRHGMLTWDQPRPPRTTVCGARGGTAGAPLADETLKTRGFKNES